MSLIIVTNISLVHFEMPLSLSASRLRQEDCATSVEYGLRPGESKLDELDTDGIWDYMMKPIVYAQEAVLRAQEGDDLIPLVPRDNTFLLLLGMVRPMQVDGVWTLMDWCTMPIEHGCYPGGNTMVYTNIVARMWWTLLRRLVPIGLQHGPWVARPRGMKP